MDDDILDILGISIFASDTESSTLKNISASLSSDEEGGEDGKGGADSDKDDG